jgi:periplasmic divalent cation tolerance protein
MGIRESLTDARIGRKLWGMRPQYFQVVTTLPARAKAEKLARGLVKLRLAACCQVIGPINSVYWWHGKVEAGREWVCLAKTERSRLKQLIRSIERTHPYDTPEVIAVSVAAGSRRYLRWLAEAVKPEGKARTCR